MGGGQILARYPPNFQFLETQGSWNEEAVFLVHTFPWETEFMNIAFMESPRCPGKRENPYSEYYNLYHQRVSPPLKETPFYQRAMLHILLGVTALSR